MSERIVLSIEPDSATVEEIRRELEPYGFSIKSIPNGEEAIEWGRGNVPSLIVLSVEPRKVGYAICNKLKRSPSLRDVPLVLISSEETLATFEQHRKLKSRADEYLLKPLDKQEFLSKVDRLLGLGIRSGEAAPEEEVHEIDADADIVIADDDVAIVGNGEDPLERTSMGGDSDDGVPATPAPAAHDVTSEQRTLLGEGEGGDAASFEGERFDPETQAAFAALEAGAAEGPPAGSEMAELRNLWSDEDVPAALNWDSPTAVGKEEVPAEAIRPDMDTTGKSASGAEAEAGSDPDSYRTGETLGPELIDQENEGSDAYATVESAVAEALDTPPNLDDVQFDDATTDGAGRGGSLEFEQPPVRQDETQLRESQAKNAELEARIRSLESERHTLRRELEEARERFTQSASFSKEREFLGLREIINKKEKDILDLRDGMDAKERQILDHKDKIRELERARRDLEEKTLGFERNLVAANERVSELVSASEKSVEREKGLKARIDEAHEQLRKAHEESEQLKRRLSQDEARLRVEMDRLRGELETRLVELEESHQAEVVKLADDRAQAEEAAEAAREAGLARIDAAHKSEVEGLQRRLAEEQALAAERLSGELAKLRKDHEKALAGLREEQSAQLASERQAYEASTEQKERDHRNEILGMSRRHEQELTAAEERRQHDITEQEARRVNELEAAEARRRAELQGRDEQHHARVTDIERRHLTEKTELAERHRSEQDQALGRAARAEGELAARAQELEQGYRRLAGLEADLDAARAELGDREVRLAQSRDHVAQLEAKVAGYEDQIVRAYQRIRADEKTAEKTRRALAVALTLMDERSNPAAPASSLSGTSSGPTVTAGATSAPVAVKPVAEEA